MKILKYLLLTLTMLNIPAVFLHFGSPSMGSLLSYATYALLILFYILNKGGKPNIWLLLIGLTYFLISGINFYSGEERTYYVYFVKYLIMIFCGTSLVKKVTENELHLFLFIGALTPIFDALLFPDQYGRYSGFYINPNVAGFIAIMAYSLTFRLKNIYTKSIAQILITIGGIVTFSRTFLLIWLFTNLLSIRISLKNIRILAAGFGLLLLLVIFGSTFKLNSERLNQLSGILNEKQGAIKNANSESRSETWSNYYDYLMEKPIFGNGYNSFQSYQEPGLNKVGVHNSYLLVLGEAGIFPFILFSSLFLYLIFMGFKVFDIAPHLSIQSIAIFLFLLTSHNFFTMDSALIITLWIYQQIKVKQQYKTQLE